MNWQFNFLNEKNLSSKKNEEFQKILFKKNSYIAKNYILFVEKNNLSNSQVGIVVSKKIGNAVIRNKIKRQIKKMVTEIFNLKISKNYIVMVRKDFLQNTYSDNLICLRLLYNKIRGV